MRAFSVIVCDTDTTTRRAVHECLVGDGARVVITSDSSHALELLKREPIDAWFIASPLDGHDSLPLVREARQIRSNLAVVLMAADARVEAAVEALHLGVSDYLIKPVTAKAISLAYSRILSDLRVPKHSPASQVAEDSEQETNIIAASTAMRDVVTLAGNVAHADVPVLLEGEAGVGKRLIARAIHKASNRVAGPFVHAAITSIRPENLEAALFGQEGNKGGPQRGLIEQAADGILFIKHVCDLPNWIQGRLTEALQQGWFRRCGGEEAVPFRARLIAATAIDWHLAMGEGLVLPAFYYQLNVVPIAIPPLRQRKEDIAPLAAHFLLRVTRSLDAATARRPVRFSKPALDRLMQYDWPGNVQELWNVVRRATLMAKGFDVSAEDVADLASRDATPIDDATTLIKVPLAGDLKAIERYIVAETIKICHGNKAAAARLLGLHRRTLYRILHAAQSKRRDTPCVTRRPLSSEDCVGQMRRSSRGESSG